MLMAVGKDASRQNDAQQLLDALAKGDASGSTLLKQMREGEATILELWQLVNKP